MIRCFFSSLTNKMPTKGVATVSKPQGTQTSLEGIVLEE